MWGSYTRGKRVEASLTSSLELHLRAQPPQPSKEAVGFQPQALKKSHYPHYDTTHFERKYENTQF